jgi:hypothetical protein
MKLLLSLIACFVSLASSHAVHAQQAHRVQPYGYGWLLSKRNGKVFAVSHKGSLPPQQSTIRINLQNKRYAIVLWTLANPSKVNATTRVRDQVAQVLKSAI